MTNTSARRLTARQLSAALAEFDRQIAVLREIGLAFGAAFPASDSVTGSIVDAWNAVHDAIADLESQRAVVAANDRPLTFAEQTSRDLILANVD